MKRVLIIEDSKFMGTLIKELLLEAGFDVIGHATSGLEGVELAVDLEPDVITVDNMLPDMTGMEVLYELKRESIGSKIIMISTISTPELICETIRRGASNYLVKPFSSNQLFESIR